MGEHVSDALHPTKPGASASLVFLDPPYGERLAAPALAALASAGWFAESALVVVEMGAKETLEAPEAFEVLDERRYGAAKVVFLGARQESERRNGLAQIPDKITS